MEKVKPPFPAIPSFNIGASILAYSNFEDEAHTMLHKLCKNTRHYSKSHAQLLKSFFLVDFSKLCESCKELTRHDLGEGEVEIFRTHLNEIPNYVSAAKFLTKPPTWYNV